MMQPPPTIWLPVVGAFSSGKSSLINALLGEALLSTDITPETALPVELQYANNPAFVAHYPDGQQQTMDSTEFAAADFAELAAQSGWVQAKVPQLQAWPNLVLVDLPGWSSGQSEHERNLDAYLQRLTRTQLEHHTVLLLVISADEGTLREYVRQRLADIDWGNGQYVLILTKTDKRVEADIASIAEHATPAVTAVMGKAPLKVIATSARKKQLDELRQLFDQLQQQTTQAPGKVDMSAVSKAVEHHLACLQEAGRGKKDRAVDVFDDVWDEMTDTVFDDILEFVPYGSAKAIGNSFLNQMDSVYVRILNKHLQHHMPQVSAELAENLDKLDLSVPDTNHFDNKLSNVTRCLKKCLGTAIEKAKPGLFSSDDPEEVGKRIRSRLRDQRDDIRSWIISSAWEALTSYLERQTEAWGRIRRLVQS